MLARTPEECLLPSLDKPSLEGLSYLLRHEEKWPQGFHWYYGHCATCAMGMADRLWGIISPKTDTWNVSGVVADTARSMKMPFGEAEDIFGLLHTQTGWSCSAVTPAMVADAIDAYLARRG